MSSASSPSAHEPPEPGARIREHLYYPSNFGSVFATCGMTVRVHLPFHGMLVISLSDEPIEIEIGSQRIRHHAMALWPKDAYFKAPRTPFLSLSVNPLHRDFRAYTKLPEPGVTQLDRAAFAAFDRIMRRAVDGTLSLQQATQLFGDLTKTTRELLPTQRRLDERSQALTTLLLRNPRASISELAAHLKLSYYRTSHVFADAVGIPFRTYQLWQKLYLTQSPLRQRASLTEVAHAAGFVDSAHFSRAFHTAYGRCPTEMFRTRTIKVFVPEGFSELQLRQ